MEKKGSFITWFFCSGITFFASGVLLIIGYWAGYQLSRRMSAGAFLGPMFLLLAAGILIASIPITAIEWMISNKKLPCCNPIILFGANTFLGILTISLTTIIYILGYNFFPSNMIAFYLQPLLLFLFFKTALILVLFDEKTRRNLLLFNLLLGTIGIVAILLLRPA